MVPVTFRRVAPGLVVYDLLYVTLASVLYGTAAAAGALVGIALTDVLWPPLCVVPGVAVFLLTLIALVGVLGLLCPTVKPGRYELMKGAVFYGWMFRSLLRRIVMLPVIRWPIFTSNVLRWLALSAMGARVSFTANMSGDVDLLDPWLLEVEPGAVIGARCLVSGHYVEGKTLVLGRVKIGKGSLLAADVGVGPGVTIGERVVVKARASIAPHVTIEDRAEVGGATVIDVAAHVGAGAKLGSRVYIGVKATVPAGAEVPAADIVRA
jgi:acetyltransferase-like isoleucine patch superfamily enzyme